MCGIFAYLIRNQKIFNYNLIYSNFMNLSNRGPDTFSFAYSKKYFLGFHRLSIMDLSNSGNQPFIYFKNNYKYTCICNGEIYNYTQLKNSLNFDFNSNSDCEILIPLYLLYGENMVNHLDGVYSFIIIKEKDDDVEYFIVRDRIGIRPLYIGYDYKNNLIISSEIKGFKDLVYNNFSSFEPGHYIKIKSDLNNYELVKCKYYELKFNILENDELYFCNLINNVLTECVKKRLVTDRPICALLSGGLDSSLVCSITSKLLNSTNFKLNTYSIGMENSPDNHYAKLVSDYIGSNHTFVNITKEDAINCIRDVIYTIESYDVTTVRASVGQYLISKYISKNSNFKVVLSGDGSDEVTGGYLENYFSPNLTEFQNNTLKRINNIHYFDVLRADKATSGNGLELRVPFLDISFINLYLSIPPKYKKPILGEKCEKYLLRKSFTNNYLPEEVLWRQKEAFSDGISNKEDSWHNVLKKLCNELVTDEEYSNNNFNLNKPRTKEAFYYRKIFDEFYDKHRFDNTIPEFWMPSWSESDDPSARDLSIYNL
jgi:asparagine synthase (glutamine-hydrolysing)